jgi:hypothetical protein
LRSGTCDVDAGSETEGIIERRHSLWLTAVRLAIRHPNASDAGSEEDKMSTIVLSAKAAKLMKLCEVEGFDKLGDLLESAALDSVCPGICMTEGCDFTTETEPDQSEGYCERCGGNTVVSALVLAGLI